MAQLKLIALEASDLTIVSAHLQDAVAKVGDMAFSKNTQRFVALCNRLARDATGSIATDERRRAALRIDRVTNAQVQGFSPSDRSAVVEILTLSFSASTDPALAPAGVLTIVCAGNATVRLEVECVEVVLEDLGPAWRASAVPEHEAD